MESITSHSPLRPDGLNHLYGANRPGSGQTNPGSDASVTQSSPSAPTQLAKVETFASMFDDSELARLQENLETIARRAEAALRQLSGRA